MVVATPLAPNNLGELRDALAASGLPLADLTEHGRTFF